MNPLWSWALTAVGVTGLYFAGKHKWWAWTMGLGAQVLWLAYAIATEQWGFIVSAGAYGTIYLKNHLAWWRDRPETLPVGTRGSDGPHVH